MDSDEIPRHEAGDQVILPGGRHAEILAVERTPYANRPGTATTLILLTKTAPPEIKKASDWMVRRPDKS